MSTQNILIIVGVALFAGVVMMLLKRKPPKRGAGGLKLPRNAPPKSD